MDNVIRISDLLPEYYGKRHYKKFSDASVEEMSRFIKIVLYYMTKGFDEHESYALAIEELGTMCPHPPEMRDYRLMSPRLVKRGVYRCKSCECVVLNDGEKEEKAKR